MDNFGKSAVARFSTAFVKNYRITLIIFLGILILGFASYTTFLKRDGFPAVEAPIVFVQTPYFVGDKNKVDQDITEPIENAISNVKEVKEIQSTTTDNFSAIVVELEEGVLPKEGASLIKEAVDQSATLPANARVEYKTFNAGSLDGEHDMIFMLSGRKSVQELQDKAAEVAEEVEEADVVAQANVIELISQETNSVTGKIFANQSSFNRVGIKQNGTIEFFPAISVGVIKRGDTSVLDLSNAVREEVEQIEDEGGLEGLQVSYGGDFAESVRQLISDLEINARNGLIAVLAVLFLFISWRASLVAAIFIPTVLAATFITLFLIGYTLNIIVLFSLILVLGLFVDDAIVVVEAIDYQKKKGLKGVNAIYTAIRNISTADIAGTLTTVLVFLPMVFISGLLGDFIQIIPITVIIALIFSLLIGLTITSFFANVFIADQKYKPEKFGIDKVVDSFTDTLLNGFGNLINYLSRVFSRFVYTYLKRPALILLVLVATVIWVVVGAAYSTNLTFAVFPPPKDSDEVQVFLSFPEGTDLPTAEEISREAESVIIDTARKHIVEVNYFEASQDGAFINIDLVPYRERDETAGEIVDGLTKGFVGFGETRVRVSLSSPGPPIDEFQINIQVFSDNQNVLARATDDLETFLLNRELGDSERITDVQVGNLESISKVDQRRFAVVRAKISDPNDSNLILAVQEDVENEYNSDRLFGLGLEEDSIDFDLGQEGENIESFTSAIFALGVALILMYILLVLQFNSFLQPLLIFLAIPFTFPLLFPGLFATENQLSFFVMLGIISLSGIVVNNTIFLVDFANQARRSGHGIAESISEAIQIRFRPIVSTSTTTIFALLPLALTDPFWESLSLTIIFGLISSSILVIISFPAFYSLVEVIRSIRDRLVEKRKRGEKLITISF